MNMRLITTTLILLSTSSFLPAADYRFVTIDVPHATFTSARGINARADIVGAYADAGGTSHAFLLRKGGFTTIDVPDAAATQGARAIKPRAAHP